MLRTNVDWSKHELTVFEQKNYIRHTLKQPDTVCKMVNFINTDGVLLVTGDYSRWSFCRCFVPAAGERVSDHYWIEKLRIGSDQEGEQFSSDLTRKQLEEGIHGGLKDEGWEGDNLKKMIEFYEKCLEYVDYSDHEYCNYSYEAMPEFACPENIPHCEEIKPQLLIVFDAFEEICRRLKAKEERDGKKRFIK